MSTKLSCHLFTWSTKLCAYILEKASFHFTFKCLQLKRNLFKKIYDKQASSMQYIVICDCRSHLFTILYNYKYSDN